MRLTVQDFFGAGETTHGDKSDAETTPAINRPRSKSGLHNGRALALAGATRVELELTKLYGVGDSTTEMEHRQSLDLLQLKLVHLQTGSKYQKMHLQLVH